MNVTLQPFSPDNQEFLFRLYSSTREHEISALGWPSAQQEAFLRMQFNSQQRWYETAYPGADHQLILIDDQPAGRILVLRDSKTYTLVDIALLTQHRNTGIGTQLLRQLIAEADKACVPLRLHVLKSNPACRLYERLGFAKTGEDGIYYEMEKKTALGP